MAESALSLPKRLPLVIEPQNRAESVDQDARLVNAFMETQQVGGQQETWIYARPGLAQHSRPPAGNAAGHGVFNWKGNIYSIFADKLYKDGVAIVGTVGTTGGVYRFSSCLGATPKMQLGDGVDAYNYDAGAGLVLINDPDFPSVFRKGWAYLDGTTYVLTAAAHIQGDDINDPTAWDPVNDILAQIEPDGGVALGKQLVYVIAFKEWSGEVFYDAGNATGSPLGSVQGAKFNYGCQSQDSVQEIDNIYIWAGSSRTAGVQVMLLDNLKMEVVSTKPIERLLQNADFSAGAVLSWQISLAGHRFYVLTLKNDNLTLVFDLDEKMWSQWTDSAGNYLPIVDATFDSGGLAIVQHESNGRLYYASLEYDDDAGAVITSDIIAPNFDAGVQARQKYLPRMYFVCDQVPGTELQVRYSEDDYKSWSDARYVDLSVKEPYIGPEGTFYRRAYWFRHSRPVRMPRLKAVELQMELCTL